MKNIEEKKEIKEEIVFDVEEYSTDILEAVFGDIACELEKRGLKVDCIEAIVHCNVKEL